MESIVRNVRDIDASDRRSLEQIVGQTLRDNQRVIIQLAEINVPKQEAAQNDARSRQTLEDWTSVYDGLSAEDIEEIDKIAKTRADLTRHLP